MVLLSGFHFTVEIVDCAKDKDLNGFPLLCKFLAHDQRDIQGFSTSHGLSTKVVQCQRVKTLLVLEFLSVLLNFVVVCVATVLVSMTVLHSACHLMVILQITIKPQ